MIGAEIELGMDFSAVVAMIAEHYEVIGHFELIDGLPVDRVFDCLEVRAR